MDKQNTEVIHIQMVFICRSNSIESSHLGPVNAVFISRWSIYAGALYIQVVFRSGLTVLESLVLLRKD